MAGFRITRFLGSAPRLGPSQLSPQHAQVARNCRLHSGELRPYRQALAVNKPAKPGTKLSLYRFGAVAGGDRQGVVTSASQTNPVQITSAQHGLATGQRVFISGVSGMAALNDRTYSVTVVDGDRFTLDAVDGTTYGAYVSGGAWVKENGFWCHWTTRVNVVRGPIAGDTTERTYYSGDGAPKVTDASLVSSGGGTSYPNNSYTLGLPAPTSAPTLSAAAPTTTDRETRFYLYTYVSGWGEEGPPSPVSASIDVDAGVAVTLANLSTAPLGAYNIQTKRIYRTSSGTQSTSFRFVAEVPVANTSFVDSVPTTNLGESLPSAEWDMPPADLHSLIALPNGIMAGLSGITVCFCAPFMPHAWPQSYQLALDYRGVALGAFGNSVAVLTEGAPYVVTGTDPAAMSMDRLALEQACVSARGVASLGDAGVLYPSPDGLVLIGSGGGRVVTAGYLDRDAWQALNPASLIGVVHDGRYYGFYAAAAGTGCLVFDPSENQGLVFLDLAPTAAWVDLLSDNIYLQLGDRIERFEGGEALQAYTWRSRLMPSSRPLNLGFAQVQAASYANLTLRLYGDGVLRHSQAVTGPAPFRLPSGYLAEQWEIELEGVANVRAVMVAENIEELRQA